MSMRRMMIVAACAGFSAAPVLASCSIDKLSLFLDRESTHTANLRLSGATTACGDHFWAGGQSEFHSLRLVQKPKRGQVGPDGAYSQISFRYVRPVNFKGRDSFTIRLRGAYRGSKGCALITYNVIAE